MFAAVDVQQHPRQRPPRPAPAMRASLLLARHQPGALQRLFHPTVAEPDAFHFPEFFMEVSHVQIEILITVECQYPLGGLHRYAVDAALATPLVEQPVIAALLI